MPALDPAPAPKRVCDGTMHLRTLRLADSLTCRRLALLPFMYMEQTRNRYVLPFLLFFSFLAAPDGWRYSSRASETATVPATELFRSPCSLHFFCLFPPSSRLVTAFLHPTAAHCSRSSWSTAQVLCTPVRLS